MVQRSRKSPTPESARRAGAGQQDGDNPRKESSPTHKGRAVGQATFRQQQQKVTDEELIHLALQRLNTVQIAAHTGVNPSTVWQRLKKLRAKGIHFPRPRHRWKGPLSKVSDEELLLLAAQGLLQSKIAALKGVTRAAINSRFKKLRAQGLLPRPAEPAPPWNQKVTDEELIHLALQRLNTVQIAAHTGLNPTSVSARLKKFRARGIELPPPQPQVRPWKRKISDEELLPLATQGLTQCEIAARKGVCQSTVSYRLMKLQAQGLLPPRVQGTGRQSQKVSNEELTQLARQGLPTRQIAARTGIRPKSVRNRLRKLRQKGIELPPLQPRQKVSDEEILLLAAQGLTQSAIAKRTGVTPNAIHQRCRKLRTRGLLPSSSPLPVLPRTLAPPSPSRRAQGT